MVIHVAELARVIVEKGTRIDVVRHHAKRTRQYNAPLTPCLEAKVSGFQRSGIVPHRLRRKVYVFFIPELPISHAVAKRGRDGHEDVAVAQQVGVVHVIAVVQLLRLRVDITPTQSVSHMRYAG